MTYVFTPPAAVSVPVRDSHLRFPVHRIYCVGRNYAAHAREMGTDPNREPPFFFCKPADAVWPLPTAAGNDGASQSVALPYATATRNLHHEIELVVAIGTGGKDIPVDQAAKHIWGYGVGLDMTRRDLQTKLKDKGQPWEIGKAFDRSAPISALIPANECNHPQSGRIWLAINGHNKQDGDISDMTWSAAEIIQHLSSYFELQPGDLIFTGTPAGVGPVESGDVITAGIDGIADIELTITPPLD